jgi:hypothetical protein
MKPVALIYLATLAAITGCRTPNSAPVAATDDGGSSLQSVTGDPSFISDARRRFTDLGMKPLQRSDPHGIPEIVKNFRVVIPGVLYRGGVQGTRGFTKPELETLCKAGFSVAVYFYDTSFHGNVINCTDKDGKPNELKYVHYVTTGTDGLGTLMVDIGNVVTKKTGPVFIHCNNGWHATGIAASIAARQFCNYNNQKVVGYLKETTDGNFRTIEGWGPRKVQNFSLNSRLSWDSETQRSLCKELLDTESNF